MSGSLEHLDEATCLLVFYEECDANDHTYTGGKTQAQGRKHPLERRASGAAPRQGQPPASHLAALEQGPLPSGVANGLLQLAFTFLSENAALLKHTPAGCQHVLLQQGWHAGQSRGHAWLPYPLLLEAMMALPKACILPLNIASARALFLA